ncbi:DUF2599 domain-containing protein [Gracilibacillus caseinilyticus]|uniref:DUF2599 domain-containing protein n=1 Tax=Gracilibacillus caseinilyticus TaxID=2932256 RepID=A0ABY4ER43_9BACI|nr:DUF2599 domain-containing protein [Gracilibacillus caseinilyticus]UOQ46663.1 DUF2599 domain-containing protein [Gracilibacillus caseinilyticus]
MQPKLSTRLLKNYANTGWQALTKIYDYIGNGSSGLYDQYMCHFDLFIESDWDIEFGQRDISYPGTIAAGCIP